METPKPANSPFEIGEGRHLRVEDPDQGIFLFPYIALRRVRATHIDERRNAHSVELKFDSGLVTIVGENLLDLLEELQREHLFLVRVGLSADVDHPQIRDIQVQLPEEDVYKDGESNDGD